MLEHDIKFFEIRDRGTTISAMAINLQRRFDRSQMENAMLAYAGYGFDTTILLIKLADCEAAYNPYEWKNNPARTMPRAHHHIEQNWENLKSGTLIDVRVLMGESPQAAEPEIMKLPMTLLWVEEK